MRAGRAAGDGVLCGHAWVSVCTCVHLPACSCVTLTLPARCPNNSPAAWLALRLVHGSCGHPLRSSPSLLLPQIQKRMQETPLLLYLKKQQFAWRTLQEGGGFFWGEDMHPDRTLFNAIDCSLPGCSVHGESMTLDARGWCTGTTQRDGMGIQGGTGDFP